LNRKNKYNYIFRDYSHVPHLINPTSENKKYCHSLLVFEPYGGCAHNCLFCYSNMGLALIHNQDRANEIHIRKKTVRLLSNYLQKYQKLKYPIRLSSTNDPLQPCEKEFHLTYESLKLFYKYKYPVILCSKGEISQNILGILKKLAEYDCIHTQISLPFLDEEISQILEPHAPLENRFRNIEKCMDNNIPLSIRYQPIFPFFKNFKAKIQNNILYFKKLGIKHIIGSFIRLPKGQFKKYVKIFEGLKNISTFNYAEFKNILNWSGEGYYIKPRRMRRKRIVEFISTICRQNSMDYTSCKEGFWRFNTIKDCCGGIYEKSSINWLISDGYSKKIKNLFSNYPQVHKFLKSNFKIKVKRHRNLIFYLN